MNVIVIGGGPAGSLAATLLARGGATVTLVEQTRFPRDKVCGECLSALGLAVLRRSGIDAPLTRVGRSIRRAHLFGRSSHATLDLPESMLGVSRAFMDDALLDAAKAAGVGVRQPARAESVTTTPSAAVVGVRDLVTNAVAEAAADFVLIADGRDALGSRRRPPTGELGIKAHFDGVAADAAAVTLYGGFGCYGGVAPIEDDRWNVAFAVPRASVAATRGDLARWWAALVADSPTLSQHFQHARRIGDWLASPLARHQPTRDWPPRDGPARVVPVGAAAGAIEPVGGEGMGTALRSAELAAAAILTGRLDTLAADYVSLWQRRSVFCRLGGWLLASEAWSDAVSFAGHPVVARPAMWLVGK